MDDLLLSMRSDGFTWCEIAVRIHVTDKQCSSRHADLLSGRDIERAEAAATYRARAADWAAAEGRDRSFHSGIVARCRSEDDPASTAWDLYHIRKLPVRTCAARMLVTVPEFFELVAAHKRKVDALTSEVAKMQTAVPGWERYSPKNDRREAAHA
jgi:hypothetical protein